MALFTVHSDNDDNAVSNDDNIVAILDEEEVFGRDTSQWDWHTCCLHNVPNIVPSLWCSCIEWRNFATSGIFGVFNSVFSIFWFETQNFACFWVLCVLSRCCRGYCYTAATRTNNVLFIFVCAPDSHDLMYNILLRIS